jgi:hypothetical protein
MEIEMIDNIARWEAGKQRNIRNNRRIGAARRWFANNADAQRVNDFLLAEGDYAPAPTVDADGHTRWAMHPIRRASLGEFFSNMQSQLNEWGALTDAQTAAVVRMIDKAGERIAEREATKEAKRASAQHVGTVGERREFDLVVKFRTSFETQFGCTQVYVCEDADGNVIVYKGSSYLTPVTCGAGQHYAEKGDRITLKATIKEHTVRDGIAQTIISRPKQ